MEREKDGGGDECFEDEADGEIDGALDDKCDGEGKDSNTEHDRGRHEDDDLAGDNPRCRRCQWHVSLSCYELGERHLLSLLLPRFLLFFLSFTFLHFFDLSSLF